MEVADVRRRFAAALEAAADAQDEGDLAGIEIGYPTPHGYFARPEAPSTHQHLAAASPRLLPS